MRTYWNPFAITISGLLTYWDPCNKRFRSLDLLVLVPFCDKVFSSLEFGTYWNPFATELSGFGTIWKHVLRIMTYWDACDNLFRILDLLGPFCNTVLRIVDLLRSFSLCDKAFKVCTYWDPFATKLSG